MIIHFRIHFIHGLVQFLALLVTSDKLGPISACSSVVITFITIASALRRADRSLVTRGGR